MGGSAGGFFKNPTNMGEGQNQGGLDLREAFQTTINPLMTIMQGIGKNLYSQGLEQSGISGVFNRATGRLLDPTSGDSGTIGNIISNLSGQGLTDYITQQNKRQAAAEAEMRLNAKGDEDAYRIAKAAYDKEAKAELDAIALAKTEADTKAADAATLLATRRRASSPYATSERGILGKRTNK